MIAADRNYGHTHQQALTRSRLAVVREGVERDVGAADDTQVLAGSDAPGELHPVALDTAALQLRPQRPLRRRFRLFESLRTVVDQQPRARGAPQDTRHRIPEPIREPRGPLEDSEGDGAVPPPSRLRRIGRRIRQVT